MSGEFDEFGTIPTLVFGEPEKTEEKKTELPAAQSDKPEAAIDDSIFSEEEKKMVDDFSRKIDIHNSSAILEYGAGAQKKMADFSEKALDNVRNKDMGEIGDMVAGLVTELENFDVEEEKGIFGFFKKQGNRAAMLKSKYDKTQVSVDKICSSLEAHQIQLMKDTAMLDKMYELNLTYYKELTMYIVAGKKRLKEIREHDLEQLMERAKTTGAPEDAQAAKDLDAKCNRFEKKIDDLELTRMIAMQTAPQIRLVQEF